MNKIKFGFFNLWHRELWNIRSTKLKKLKPQKLNQSQIPNFQKFNAIIKPCLFNLSIQETQIGISYEMHTLMQIISMLNTIILSAKNEGQFIHSK
jgi:hypothetical protein